MTGTTNEVRLGHFLQQFPLRGHGQYHFRFRVQDQLSGHIWMDMNDPTALLPLYNKNMIYAKVLRLDRLPRPRPSRLRRKAPHMVKAGTTERNVGTTSWRQEQEAQRRMAQEHADSRRSHWQGQGAGTGRTRSASPAHQHHINSDLRSDISKGKSATPPSSYGSGKTAAAPPPPPRGPPPVPARPQNFESFLYSDARPGGPHSNAGPQVRSNGDFQKPEVPVARSGSGASARNGDGVGGLPHSNSFERRRAGAAGLRGKGSKSGDDLLNFGNDTNKTGVTGASAAPGGRPKGRSSPPPGWGGTHSSDGRASPGRQSAAGRMQGPKNGSGAPSDEGGAVGGAMGSSNGTERRTSFGGAAGRGGSGSDDGPDLMNVNAGGGIGGGADGARPHGGDRSAFVQSKKAERERDVEKAAKKAVQFKKDMDEAAAKDQEDLDAAKQKYDTRLTAWAEDHGKKRNIRTLLSTMHTVLWEGNRWKPVTVADLIQPSKVKVAYRKSMLLVHPDKCGSLGPEERLIAKRVFEAVNEAYTIFAEKEMQG